MSYRNQSTGAGWKVLSIFLALVLIAGAVTGLIFWQKGNIEFHKEVTEEDEMSESVIVSPDEGRGMTLSVRATDNEAGAGVDGIQILQVAGGAVNVGWQIGFADPQGEWATGKTLTDYVELTVAEDDSRNAMLTCYAAFCEQIIVTATNLDYPAAYATATVDYARRIEDVTVTLTGEDSGEQIASAAGDEVLYIPFDDTQSISVSVIPTFGEGTTDDVFTYEVSMDIELMGQFAFANIDLSDFGGKLNGQYSVMRSAGSLSNLEWKGTIFGGYMIISHFFPSYEDNEGLHKLPAEDIQKIYDNLRTANNRSQDKVVTLNINIAGQRVEFSKSIPLYYTPEVTLSAPNILF